METKSVSTQTLEYHSAMDCINNQENKGTSTSNNEGNYSGLVSDCRCFHNVMSTRQDCSCNCVEKNQPTFENSIQQADSTLEKKSQYEKDTSTIPQETAPPSGKTTSTSELILVLCKCGTPHYTECHLKPVEAKQAAHSLHKEDKDTSAVSPGLSVPKDEPQELTAEVQSPSQKKSFCCQTHAIGIELKIKCSPTTTGTQCQKETHAHAACVPADSTPAITLVVPCEVGFTDNLVTTQSSGARTLECNANCKEAEGCDNETHGIAQGKVEISEELKTMQNDACVGNTELPLVSCYCQTSNVQDTPNCLKQKIEDNLAMKKSACSQAQNIALGIKCSETGSGTECVIKTRINIACGPDLTTPVAIEAPQQCDASSRISDMSLLLCKREAPCENVTHADILNTSGQTDSEVLKLYCVENKISESLFCVCSKMSERMIFYENPVNKTTDASTETCIESLAKLGGEVELNENANNPEVINHLTPIDQFTEPDVGVYKDEASQVEMKTPEQESTEVLMVDETSQTFKTENPQSRSELRSSSSDSQTSGSVTVKLSVELSESGRQEHIDKTKNQNCSCNRVITRHKCPVSQIKQSGARVLLKNCTFTFPESSLAQKKFKKKPLKIIKLKVSSSRISSSLSKCITKKRNVNQPSDRFAKKKECLVPTSKPLDTCQATMETANHCQGVYQCEKEKDLAPKHIETKSNPKPLPPCQKVLSNEKCPTHLPREKMCCLKTTAAKCELQTPSSRGVIIERIEGFSQTDVPVVKQVGTETRPNIEDSIVIEVATKCTQAPERNKCSHKASKCTNVSIIVQKSRSCKERGTCTHGSLRSYPILKTSPSQPTTERRPVVVQTPLPPQQPVSEAVEKVEESRDETVKHVDEDVQARPELSVQTSAQGIEGKVVAAPPPPPPPPPPHTSLTDSDGSIKSYGKEPVEKAALMKLPEYASYESVPRRESSIKLPKLNLDSNDSLPRGSNDSTNLDNLRYIEGEEVHSLSSLLSEDSEPQRSSGTPASQRSTVYFHKEEGTSGITFKSFMPEMAPRQDSLDSPPSSAISLVSLHSAETPEATEERLSTPSPTPPPKDRADGERAGASLSRSSRRTVAAKDKKGSGKKSKEKPEERREESHEEKEEVAERKKEAERVRRRDAVSFDKKPSISGIRRSQQMIKCRPYGRTKPVCFGRNAGYCIEEIRPNPESKSDNPIFILKSHEEGREGRKPR